MTTPDLTNAAFEFFGGFAIWRHVRRLRIDKQIRGADTWATVFFAAWGVWNLFYYPHLGQWASFFAGLNVVAANTAWVILMWRYRHA